MLPFQVFVWGAIPVVSLCVIAGVRNRFIAAQDARLSSLRSLGATAESFRHQQNEILQRAMREARNRPI